VKTINSYYRVVSNKKILYNIGDNPVAIDKSFINLFYYKNN